MNIESNQLSTERSDILMTQQKQMICDIYSTHHKENKWILMIDPEVSALKSLSKDNTIDATKILKVNSNKVNLAAENIQKALTKGNCSAVVLCKKLFAQAQIDWLSQQAEKYNTDFIVLNNSVTIH